MSGGKQRIDGQLAYILHSYPYSETSLILDIFSREYGRLPLLARGARRPRSALRGVLQAFQPLELGWFGGGEVRTLAKAEWVGGMPLLGGTALMLGYYLNELLLKLLPRDDAHPALFDCYAQTLQQLAEEQGGAGNRAAPAPRALGAPARLRQFEKNLLGELGYGLLLERDALSGAPLEAGHLYHYRIERGPVALSAAEDNIGLGEAVPAQAQVQALRGKTLLDLARDDYSDPRTLAEAKQLMRMLINHHLSGQALQSRRVFVELQEL